MEKNVLVNTGSHLALNAIRFSIERWAILHYSYNIHIIKK